MTTMTSTANPTSSSAAALALHLGIGEQGKLLALAGDHREALIHYRAAIRLAVEQQAPEVFFRHYMECSLESLERMGSFMEVLEYCDRALDHYTRVPLDSLPEASRPLVRRDLAHVHLRRGACLLKLGERDLAREALAACLACEAGPMPLASSLMQWLRSGWHCDVARIVAEQQRHGYFTVRKDNVDPARARELPAALRPPI